jgi:hypothetical protein
VTHAGEGEADEVDATQAGGALRAAGMTEEAHVPARIAPPIHGTKKAGDELPTGLEPPASVLERNMAREDLAREDARTASEVDTPYTLHPTPYNLHPTPSTLHPTPYTSHPTPSTLNPTLRTVHPQPSTLYPSPSTLNPKLYNLNTKP